LRGHSPPFQRHVISKPDFRGWNLLPASFHEGGVILEEFGQHRRQAPAIQNYMVKTDNELKHVVAVKLDMNPQQRGGGTVERPSLFNADPTVQRLFLCAGIPMPEVFDGE